MTSFVLNEEAAHDWVTSLIISCELADLDLDNGLSTLGPTPQLSLDWQPREPGQEDAVSALVRHAHRQPGVLAHPECAEVAIEFVDDGDDWSYHFLLNIRAPTSVTLTSTPKEVCRLGDDSAFGVNAALGVLFEAAQTAEALLEQLDAFVKATTHLATLTDCKNSCHRRSQT